MAKMLYPAAYRSPTPRPDPSKSRMSQRPGSLPVIRPPAPRAGGGGPTKDLSRGKVPYSPNMIRPGIRRMLPTMGRAPGPASIRPRNLLGDGIGKDPNRVNPVPFKNPAILANREAMQTYGPGGQLDRSIRGDLPARLMELWTALTGGGAQQ